MLASPLSILYAIIIAIWITLFHESWMRKENSIGNEWLVRDYQDVTTERADYKAEVIVDPETAHQEKVTMRNAYKMQLCVGVPVSLLFMGLVVGCQVAMQYFNYNMSKDEQDDVALKNKLPSYAKYLPGVVNSCLIVLFGTIYKWLARKLVILENH